MRAAVIGCGWIGSEVADDPRAAGVQSHAGAYARCAQTRLVGVCDSDPARAARAAARWELPRGYATVAELLSEARPEVVSVCTPDATHGAVLREVLESPGVRAVVAEKPLATSLAEARALVSLARDRGVHLAVNYSRRFSPSHVAARQRMLAGEIGSPVCLLGTYTKGVLHNGSHWFDLAQFMIGPIASVQSWPAATPLDAEDPTCHVRVVFAEGQSGHLAGLDERNYTVFEFDVLGTAGRLRLTDSGMQQAWYGVGDSAHHSGYRVLHARADQAGDFNDVALRLVENVIAAVTQGAPLACSGADALAALAVSEAARTSLRSGREVEVDRSMESRS